MAVLDTSFLIDLERRPKRTHPALEALVDSAEPLIVPMAAAVELAQGSLDPEMAFAALDERFELRSFDREIALAGARLGASAHRAGKHPGAADLQIAATALVARTYVVTSNARDFRDKLGVAVWDYTRDAFPPA